MAEQIPQQSFIQSLFGGFKKKPSLSGPTKVDLSYQLPPEVVAAMNQDARLGSMAAQTTLGTGTDLFTAILKETERAVYGERVIKKHGGEDKILAYVSDTLDESLSDPAYNELKNIADWSDKDNIKKDYESYIKNYQARSNAERIKNGQTPIEGYGLYEKALPAKVEAPGRLGIGSYIRLQARTEAQAHFQAFFDEPMGKYGLPLAAQADIHKELPKMFEWKLSSKSRALEAEKDKLEVALGTHQVAGGSYTSPAAAALRTKLAEIERKLKVIEEALDSDTATSAKNELKAHLNEKTKNILSWLVRRYQDGRIWIDYITNPVGTFWKQAVMGENKLFGQIGGFELQKKVKEFQNKIWRSLPGGRVLRRLSFLRNPRLAFLRLAGRGLVKGSKFLLKNFVLSGLRLLLPKLALLMFKGALMVSKFAIGIGVALVKVVIAKFGSILAALSAAASFIGAGLSALFAGVTLASLAIAGAVVAVGITIGLAVSLLVVYPFLDFIGSGGFQGNPRFVTQIKSPVLQGIFIDAAQRACVPPELMLAIAQREAGGSFNYTDAQVAQFTTPGWWLTASDEELRQGYCYNTCADASLGCIGSDVQGIMQFERGTFNGYIDRVREVVGHEPNRCNAKDVIYAAAFKIKDNSGTGAGVCSGWSDGAVRQVAGRYCGGDCVDSSACGRGYCEDVLQKYKNYLSYAAGSGNVAMLEAFLVTPSDLVGWCARFIDQLMVNAGYEPIRKGYAVEYFEAAKAMGYQTFDAGFAAPQPGDIVVWSNLGGSGGRPGHIDMVWAVDDLTVTLVGNAGERFVAQRLANSFQAPPAVGNDELIPVGLIRLPTK